MATPDLIQRPLFPHRLSGITTPPDGKVALAFDKDGHFITDQLVQSDQPPAALFVFADPAYVDTWRAQPPEHIRALINAPDDTMIKDHRHDV